LSFKPAERWKNKALFQLLWPLVIEQILMVTMGIADTVMVSTIGEFAVSGVSIVDVINNLFIIAFGALATGGSVVVSQYIGRKNEKRSAQSSRQLVYASLGVSFFIMLIGVFLRKPILSLVYGNIESNVMEAASIYFLISALGYPVLALYNASAALFRSMGNSRIPMLTSLFVNILNIGGNAILIFGFRMGIAGAALATLISRTTAAFFLTTLLVRGKYRYSPVSLSGILRIHIDLSIIKSILNVGIPSGIESSTFQVGKILVSRIFTSFGTPAIAANAIATSINSFSYMPGTAFGMGLLTVAGQCIGAKDYVAVKKYTKKIITWGYIVLAVLNSLILLFAAPLSGIFNLGPQAAQLLKSYLRIHSVAAPLFWPLAFIVPNALRAAGDGKYCMITSTITMWIVRITIAHLLAYPLGIGSTAVYYAMGADFALRGFLFTRRWMSGRWQKKNVLADS
jgi:putative MATE family efflux protein